MHLVVGGAAERQRLIHLVLRLVEARGHREHEPGREMAGGQHGLGLRARAHVDGLARFGEGVLEIVRPERREAHPRQRRRLLHRVAGAARKLQQPGGLRMRSREVAQNEKHP